MSHDAARVCALGANAVVGAHGVHAAADGIEWKAVPRASGADRKRKGGRDAHVGGFGGPMGSALGADSTHAFTSARATRPARRARAIADIRERERETAVPRGAVWVGRAGGGGKGLLFGRRVSSQ
jgi:hypothetical protein